MTRCFTGMDTKLIDRRAVVPALFTREYNRWCLDSK